MKKSRAQRTQNKARARTGDAAATRDSFQNFVARLGTGTGNQNDVSTYGFNPISRVRLKLEYAYRGSWICRAAVDCMAEDMTREGVTVKSDDEPDRLQKLAKEVARLQLWAQLCQSVKWSRLYGGALAFLMIDGQDPSTPLRLETLRKGQFRGLLPLDRWLVNPSLDDLVTDMGPDFGKPRFYTTVPDTSGMPLLKIHYSRVIRLAGVDLPYWQQITERLWGSSILEPLWARLIAFDSATTGVAQLVYKAHLRTYKVEGLRDIIAMGGDALNGLTAQINMIRSVQSNEGMTLMDAKDEFETHQYAFAGLDAVLEQFKDQVAGALETPKMRLFGQSSGGLGSTGQGELRNYYDSVRQKQARILGPGVETLYRVTYISTFGVMPPESFELDFKPLWQMDDEAKANVADTVTAAIDKVHESQIIDRSTALRELKHLSHVTGVFTSITDEQIKEAENDPPPSPEMLGLVAPKPVPGRPGAAAAAKPDQDA